MKAWLAKHPRFLSTSRRLRARGSTWSSGGSVSSPTKPSVVACSARWTQLIEAIFAYLDAHNADPKPFIWTVSSEEILAKVRGRIALRQVASYV